jgi:hypothetical protein
MTQIHLFGLLWTCCGSVVQLVVGPQLNLHSFELLWACYTTCCTTNLQQIERVEFELRNIRQMLRICCGFVVQHVVELVESCGFVAELL